MSRMSPSTHSIGFGKESTELRLLPGRCGAFTRQPAFANSSAIKLPTSPLEPVINTTGAVRDALFKRKVVKLQSWRVVKLLCSSFTLFNGLFSYFPTLQLSN